MSTFEQVGHWATLGGAIHMDSIQPAQLIMVAQWPIAYFLNFFTCHVSAWIDTLNLVLLNFLFVLNDTCHMITCWNSTLKNGILWTTCAEIHAPVFIVFFNYLIPCLNFNGLPLFSVVAFTWNIPFLLYPIGILLFTLWFRSPSSMVSSHLT